METETEVSWARNVYEIIRNYQFKYGTVLQDIAQRKTRVKRMRRVVNVLKRAKIQTILQADLQKATRELHTLANAKANSPVDRAGYHIARTRLGFMANGLKSLKDRNVERVLASADQTLVDVAAELTPPSSKDLLRSLTRK